MDFFIPYAENVEQQQKVYDAIRTSISRKEGIILSDRRIFRLEYHRDGVQYNVGVGDIHPVNRELVFAIFYEELKINYHICTTNRGVAHGVSIPIDVNTVQSVQDFGT